MKISPIVTTKQDFDEIVKREALETYATIDEAIEAATSQNRSRILTHFQVGPSPCRPGQRDTRDPARWAVLKQRPEGF